MQIISRKDWGARHSAGFTAAPLPARELYLHHSVTIAPDLVQPFDDDYAAVRQLEQIGQSRFGGGISYTFAVTPAGLVFEGHGVARQGAHTGGRNSIARAIVLVGDYDRDTPSQPMVAAVVELVRHGHAQGWWPDRLTGGHRDAPGASTACPGRWAAALIPMINNLAVASSQEDDMLSESELKQIRDAVWQAPIDDVLNKGKVLQAWQHMQWANGHASYADAAAEHAAKQTDAILAALDALRGEVAALKAAGGLDPGARYRLVSE